MILKRTFDTVVASVLLLLFLIPGLLVAIVVFWNLGRPVLFVQWRPGLKGKLFKLYKFRTMKDAVNSKGELLPDEKRLTRFGRLLRSTSLDELPELVNIIKGDMSFVGPRPLLVEYLPFYTREQMCRHDVRPGLTGWAQVNGRNASSWEERFRYDAEYVAQQSFVFDLKILLKTFLIVFKREGVSHGDHVTMPRFDDYMREKNDTK